MPPLDEAKRWLDQATSDLDFARLGAANGYFAQACFMAQQAAEKAVKSLHYLSGARIVIGHSVAHLLRGLPAPLQAPPSLVQAAQVLDQFYIPARYPDGLPGGTPSQYYTQAQATQALCDADQILFHARAQVPLQPPTPLPPVPPTQGTP
ncbi:MAG: HEPN domain-containing protein [Planctomycetes bacterium]|nr:HEPN domain-containing protein [Planctomycetota bacterium]